MKKKQSFSWCTIYNCW